MADETRHHDDELAAALERTTEYRGEDTNLWERALDQVRAEDAARGGRMWIARARTIGGLALAASVVVVVGVALWRPGAGTTPPIAKGPATAPVAAGAEAEAAEHSRTLAEALDAAAATGASTARGAELTRQMGRIGHYDAALEPSAGGTLIDLEGATASDLESLAISQHRYYDAPDDERGAPAVEISLEVESILATFRDMERIADASFGGWIESAAFDASVGAPTGTLVVRAPMDRIDEALATLEGLVVAEPAAGVEADAAKGRSDGGARAERGPSREAEATATATRGVRNAAYIRVIVRLVERR
jgi:hypothetical protein